MKIVFLGIGTNLGNRESNLREAVKEISEHIGTVISSSSVYETEPWGFEAKTEFLNMVVKAGTDLLPADLLGMIKNIETSMGRVKGTMRYSSRPIDIDILFYDDLIIDEESLKIPHPLLHMRRFVLVPLNEIAHEIVHPVFKKSVGKLLELCEDKGEVKKFMIHNNPLSAKL